MLVLCQRCGEEFESRRRDAKWCPACRVIVLRGQIREGARRLAEKRKHPCLLCGVPVHRKSRLCITCENERRAGEEHPSWKGGHFWSNGYVYIRCFKANADNKNRAFYRREHIVVWEQGHGMPIPKGWVIHHLNGVKDDNRLENLVAASRKEHFGRNIVKPYEQRIRTLEQELQELQQLRLE